MNINIEQLKPLLTEVSQKLGQGAGFTWEAVYRQQFIDGALGVFGVLIGIVVLYAAYYSYKVGQNADRYSDKKTWATGLSISFFLWGVLQVTFAIEETILHFANPEYQAILDLIKMLK